MKGNSRTPGPVLKAPTGTGYSDRAPGANRGSSAPTHYRRRYTAAGRKQSDGPVILRELETARCRRTMGFLPRQPSRGYEPSRLETETAQPLESPAQPIRCARGIQCEKFCFPRGPAPGFPSISPAAGQAHFVVPLTMQYQLGTFLSTVPQPGHKPGVMLQRPPSMPLGYDEERGHDALSNAEIPESRHARAQCRRDIVD